MPRIRVTKPYDHPTSTGHLAYPVGFEGDVSAAVAKAAVAAGKAEVVADPATPPVESKPKT